MGGGLHGGRVACAVSDERWSDGYPASRSQPGASPRQMDPAEIINEKVRPCWGVGCSDKEGGGWRAARFEGVLRELTDVQVCRSCISAQPRAHVCM